MLDLLLLDMIFYFYSVICNDLILYYLYILCNIYLIKKAFYIVSYSHILISLIYPVG